jgi:DNA-binding transcriptional ArsR family regulator
VPDTLFDELLSELSGAELKVVLYIIRRTFGFKRQTDTIAISQLLHGITKKTGEVLDRGTGLSKSTLLQALRTLTEKNIIIPARRFDERGGFMATEYRLNIASTPPVSQHETPP